MKNLLKSFMALQLPCGALFRLYFCLHVIQFALVGLFESRSLTYKVAFHAGDHGFAVLSILLCLALLGLIDTVINDVLPEPYTFDSALDCRHHLAIAMAMCFAVLMWFALSIRSYASIPFYSLQIFFLLVSAVVDIRERYQFSFRAALREVAHAKG